MPGVENDYGQLGIGNYYEYVTSPTLISASAFNNEAVIAISAGDNHSLALTSTGKVYSFGYNNSGQLGDGGSVTYFTPHLSFSTVGGASVATITAGYCHGLCISSAHKQYSWGGNGCGELGIGTTTLSRSPVKVTFLGPDYLFANNLSEYKTCIDYEAAYTDLNDDYEALDNTEKTNLSSIMISDYLTQAAYEGGTKSISVSALTKWNEICSLHASTLLGLNTIHNSNSLIKQDILMICLFTIIGSACLYVVIVKTRKHVSR